MPILKALPVKLCVALSLLCFIGACSFAEAVTVPGPITHSRALPNGVELRGSLAAMQVIALRDDVIRVRLSPTPQLPEDASWATLPQARKSAVSVTPSSGPGFVGFQTRLLQVKISRLDFSITILDREGKILQQDASPVEFTGRGFRISKSMPTDEHYFGLGDKVGPLDRRGLSFTLWNTDAYQWQESTDPLYKSIPFYMSFRRGQALGVLLDNTWRSRFDFGREVPDTLTLGSVNGPIDYYIIYGPTPKQVLTAYSWLTGPTPLPPLWALGFQQSRYSYMPQSRVLDVAQRLRADKIPTDVIYLDIDYQQKNRPFTIDREQFPQFEKMIADLHAQNFHVVAITDLHIANLPNQGYAPYDSGISGDQFVKNPDGAVYSGKVWPGPSVFPDFTRQQTREWWGGLYRSFAAVGIDGFWNDMNEPSVFDSPTLTIPENVLHRVSEPGFASRTATHSEIHNVYGMENSRATYEGLLKLSPELRPFVLTRATYAGGQRYAATWTGDNSSTWNHLRLTTPMLKNLGLSGFALSGADAGGYAGTPTPELFTKWMEIASFQPIDRNHTEKGTADKEPWIGGPEQEAIRRHFVEERYRLMPYIYTTAEETSRDGLPILRPLFLEFPDAAPDRHPLDIDRTAAAEFLLGPNLLIAPSPYPEKVDAYQVVFPSAGWYDYWSGQQVEPPAPVVHSSTVDPNGPSDLPSVTIVPQLASLPIYVRPGAIIPMEPLVQNTDEKPQGPLTVRVYRGPDCHGELYQDDGKSFAYRTGASVRVNFTCEVVNQQLRVHIGPHQGTYPAWWDSINVEVYGWRGNSPTVTVDGKTQSLPEQPNGQLSITIRDDGKGAELVWN